MRESKEKLAIQEKETTERSKKTMKEQLKVIKIKVEKTANNDLINRMTPGNSVDPLERSDILLEAKLANQTEESGPQKSYRLKQIKHTRQF